jgi:hypothetical protein
MTNISVCLSAAAKAVRKVEICRQTPLPRVSRSNPESPVPKLAVFRFREEGHSVYLLHTERTRNVLQHRKTRHPQVAREQLSGKICHFGFA